MKSLKVAVIACSLFAAAAASAQTESGATNAPQQVAQSNASSAPAKQGRSDAATPKKDDNCVGPASFCNVYFGS